MAKLSINNISTAALKGFSADIENGTVALIGSGTYEVLRAVAGTDKLVSGDITLNGAGIAGVPAKKRKVVMTANPAEASPRMTVKKFIFAELKRMGQADESRIAKIAKQLVAEDILEKKLRELSAVQLKKAVLCRALAGDADAYLLDEPYAGLNADAKSALNDVIASKNAAVVVSVSDINEVAGINCRVLFMENGKVIQDASAEEIIARPDNVAAAGMNIIKAKLAPREGRMFAAAGDFAIRIPDLTVKKLKSDIYIGKDIYLGVRDAAITDDAAFIAENPVSAFEAVAEKNVLTGNGRILTVKPAGAEVCLKARVSDNCRAAKGETVKLAIDTAKLFLFDAATGDNILF